MKKNIKNLVILESPTKTKAIKSYLGDNFEVTSSEGHIRNLSSTGEHSLGIDLNTFTPKYKIERNKKVIVEKLKKLAKLAEMVIIATDPDREGEAIAYHLKEVLNISDKYKRVRFNEITKKAVLNAFENLVEIDMNIFYSQETRRILDRFIGYRLSKLLYNKIKSKSAGRVQSVALKLLVERHKEREDFKKEEYWTIEGEYKKIPIKLVKYDNKEINIKNQKKVLEIKNNLSKNYQIIDNSESIRRKSPPKPLTTSMMLQQASINLNFTPLKTSFLAQQLYEGIKIENNKIKGFISYPRTDSKRLSQSFINEVNNFIKEKYGEKYLGKYINNKSSKNVQDAHEAIRPTDPRMTIEKAKKYLKLDQLKLYKLIYNSSISSLMANAKYLNKKIKLDNNNYQFVMNGSTMIFDGYLKLMNLDKEKNIEIPNLQKNDFINLDKLLGFQHFTKPPNKYSIATLIKKMEDLGIGRPSTYSLIIYTLQKRGYITVENKTLSTTNKGILTNEMLQEYFHDIINEDYTSKVEEKLDEIASGKIKHVPILKDFWIKFEPRVLNAMEKMPEVPIEKPGIKCPKCENDLVYRYGLYGKFIGCGNFPKCRYILQNSETFGSCPKCENGKLVMKINKRKQKFKACNNFPECKYIESYSNKEEETKIEKKVKKDILFSIDLLK